MYGSKASYKVWKAWCKIISCNTSFSFLYEMITQSSSFFKFLLNLPLAAIQTGTHRHLLQSGSLFQSIRNRSLEKVISPNLSRKLDLIRIRQNKSQTAFTRGFRLTSLSDKIFTWVKVRNCPATWQLWAWFRLPLARSTQPSRAWSIWPKISWVKSKILSCRVFK